MDYVVIEKGKNYSKFNEEQNGSSTFYAELS
jgi:hypothetical protein